MQMIEKPEPTRVLRGFSMRFWDLVHNCVAHPLMGIAPGKTTDRFHDWTAEKL